MSGITTLWASVSQGTTSGSVSISDQFIVEFKIAVPPPTSDKAIAGYELNSFGDAFQFRSNGPTPISGEWLISGVSSAFDVRATVLSGSIPLGSSVDVWLNMNQLNSWRVERAADSVGITTSKLFVEIRDAVSLIVLDTATIDLQVEVSN